jgi:hypothetical protein
MVDSATSGGERWAWSGAARAWRTAWRAAHERIVVLETEKTALTQQLAALRASFEWLTQHVNRLERERAVLLQRVLGVTLPVPEIGRASEPDRVGVATPPTAPTQPDYSTTIAGLQALGAAFEDVGDELAAQLGLRHDEFGNVRSTR